MKLRTVEFESTFISAKFGHSGEAGFLNAQPSR